MLNNFKYDFCGFGGELLERMHDNQQERLDDPEFEERIAGIENQQLQ